MKNRLILASTILLSGAVFAEPVLDEAAVLRSIPATPHQLMVLTKFKPALAGARQGEEATGGERLEQGEFARFEMMQTLIKDAGAYGSPEEYTLSPAEREILGLSPRRSRKAGESSKE